VCVIAHTNGDFTMSSAPAVNDETPTPRRLGLVLPQRGALFGTTTIPELVEAGHLADESGAYDSVWIGDSLLAKPRPESIALLGSLASVTRKVKLAVGCMSSFPVRDPILLADQWATLDQLTGGRMLLAACTGIIKERDASEREGAALYGVTDRSRTGRLEENMEILRRLWAEDTVTFRGRYRSFDEVRVLPKPVQKPPPIYIASNPHPAMHAERPLRRVARLADGWMTQRITPEYLTVNWPQVRQYLIEEGRDPAAFPVLAYYNVNINPDREAAYDESFRFFNDYYGPVFTDDDIRQWTAAGTVQQVIDDINRVFAEGATEVALRITSWDWRLQLRLLTEEVIPAVRSAS
jgi:alkanesulfonate monooxygenase SsuD/methylene tetrahydromethanopterin reductase-like flavin-dependent oxidoreductase (luciferase family)